MTCSINTKQYQGKGSEGYIGKNMSRTSQLKDEARRVLDSIKTGSHQKRAYRKKVLFRFVNALSGTEFVPPTWYGLNKNHIASVVQYWRNKNLNDNSIRMYLADIRYFLQTIKHDISNIDNRSLGLNRSREKDKRPFSPDCLQKISDKVVILLLKLQTEFGLTLSEAFRFTPDLHIREQFLLLSRDMTNNSSDRSVEISTQNQKDVICLAESIIEMNQNPIKQHGYTLLREQYRHEIIKAGLSPKANYRYVYARARLANLEKANKPADAKRIVLSEMGITGLTLWRYLNEPG